MTVWVVTKTIEHAESNTTDIVKIFDNKEKAVAFYQSKEEETKYKWSISYNYEEYEVE